jgi:hypothetical protein
MSSYVLTGTVLLGQGVDATKTFDCCLMPLPLRVLIDNSLPLTFKTQLVSAHLVGLDPGQT